MTAKQSTLETLKKYLEQEHGYYFELDHYIDQCYSQQVSLYRKRASCRSVNILIKFVLLRMLIKIQHIFYTLFWLFGGILDSRSCTSLGRTFNLIRYDHSKSKSSTSPSPKQQNPLLFNRMVFSKGDRCWNGPERSLTVYTLFPSFWWSIGGSRLWLWSFFAINYWTVYLCVSGRFPYSYSLWTHRISFQYHLFLCS